jgi:hypothetical protein
MFLQFERIENISLFFTPTPEGAINLLFLPEQQFPEG